MVSRKAHNLKNLVRFQVPQQEKNQWFNHWFLIFYQNCAIALGG